VDGRYGNWKNTNGLSAGGMVGIMSIAPARTAYLYEIHYSVKDGSIAICGMMLMNIYKVSSCSEGR
jgi:hypothetical protein